MKKISASQVYKDLSVAMDNFSKGIILYTVGRPQEARKRAKVFTRALRKYARECKKLARQKAMEK